MGVQTARAREGDGLWRSDRRCLFFFFSLLGAWTLVSACSDRNVDGPRELKDVAAEVALASDVAPSPETCVKDADCDPAPWPCVQARCLPEGRCAWVNEADGVACDDGDPCTAGEVCSSGHCGGGKDACHCQTKADCADLDNGDLCDGVYFCDTSAEPSICRVDPTSVVNCPPPKDPQCAVAVCDKTSAACGLKSFAEGTPCEDGEACTAGDHCVAGSCESGESVCPCKVSADCADFEDGDLCNGTLYCDNTHFPFVCKVNPATVVTCPTGNNTACSINTCDPKTANCAQLSVADKTACDDGDACSKGDVCLAGVCQPGDNVCPCTKNADCAAFEDGDLCNGTLYCDITLDSPGCVLNPATVVSCPTVDDTACMELLCQPKSGKCLSTPVHEKEACDDGNVCTVGDHCAQGACVYASNTCKCVAQKDCAQYEDGDLCNGTLYCDKTSAPFVCNINKTTKIKCSASKDTSCLRNTCEPKSGTCVMSPYAQGQSCDADGNPCTTGDVCDKGVCVAGPNICPCEKLGDCVKHEDGDLCNGTLYCDMIAKPPVCRVNPNTIVSCSKIEDTPCRRNLCDGKVGACKLSAVRQGQVCEADGNACTPQDSCSDGQCMEGSNICECQSDGDCAEKEDGDLCNGTLFCNKSSKPFVCEVNPATVVSCDPSKDEPCRRNLCVKESGQCVLSELPDNTFCEDGDICTVGDVCEQGACEPGTSICGCATDADCASWDDGDLCNGLLFCDVTLKPHVCRPKLDSSVSCPAEALPCSEVWCVPSTGLCANKPSLLKDGKSCDDGDACTAQDSCAVGQCVGLALEVSVACDDANPCTAESCDSKVGCVHLSQNGSCSDGDPCTVGDACGAGECVPGPDLCECKKDADCAAKEDGDLCNGTLRCDKAQALWKCAVDLATVVTCDSAGDSACLAAACQPLSGLCKLAPAHEGEGCDADGNVCTVKDACVSGLCQAGKALVCDDGNACTIDSCHATLGCEVTPTQGPCSDGDACTIGEACVSGVCKGGSPQSCDDHNPCTWDGCHPVKGCTHAVNSAPCDDGNPCTTDEVCAGGVCKSATGACDCQQDFDCVAKDDGDLCNGKLFCDKKGGAGICRPLPNSIVVCKPSDDPCKETSCHPTTGLCLALPLKDGTSCDADNSKCTVGDACVAGSCKAGVPLVCTGSSLCKTSVCEASVGCVVKNNPDGFPCNDDDACTLNDKCSAGSCKAGAPKVCDDSNACTADKCVAGLCVFEAYPAGSHKPCEDTDPCTLKDSCVAGICVGGTQKNCDDDDICTQDSCLPGSGCSYLPIPGCVSD